MRKRKVTIYSVYDADGSLDGRGSARELAEKYCTDPQAIWRVAKGYAKRLQWRYTIVIEPEKEVREV